MIYPNGFITVQKLERIVEDPNYIVYAEKNVKEPEGWDWARDGIPRGERTPITDRETLNKFILDPGYTICYDIDSLYYSIHPFPGESCIQVKKEFRFEYSGKKNYAILPTNTNDSYSNKPVDSLELVVYEKEFGSTCCVVGYFSVYKGDFTFESVADRLFEIDCEDLETIMKALKEAYDFLTSGGENE